MLASAKPGASWAWQQLVQLPWVPSYFKALQGPARVELLPSPHPSSGRPTTPQAPTVCQVRDTAEIRQGFHSLPRPREGIHSLIYSANVYQVSPWCQAQGAGNRWCTGQMWSLVSRSALLRRGDERGSNHKAAG